MDNNNNRVDKCKVGSTGGSRCCALSPPYFPFMCIRFWFRLNFFNGCFVSHQKEVKLVEMGNGGAGNIGKGDERRRRKQKWRQRTGKRNGSKSNEELVIQLLLWNLSVVDIFRGARNSCKRNANETKKRNAKNGINNVECDKSYKCEPRSGVGAGANSAKGNE